MVQRVCQGLAEQPPAASGAELLCEFHSHQLGSLLAGEGNGQLVLAKPRLSWRNVISWDLSSFPSSWEDGEGGCRGRVLDATRKAQNPVGGQQPAQQAPGLWVDPGWVLRAHPAAQSPPPQLDGAGRRCEERLWVEIGTGRDHSVLTIRDLAWGN